MSADIIQFRPRPNSDREKQLERLALCIITEALMGEPGWVRTDHPIIHIDTAQDEPA